MNVQQGDLAVVIRRPFQEPRGLGAFVEVLRASDPGSYEAHGLVGIVATWWVRSSSPLLMDNRRLCTEFRVPDAFLRPIRDSDEQDEMIRIAGLPREVAHG